MENYISLKKQIIIGCIPWIGSLIVLAMSFINFIRLPKALDKILFGIGFLMFGAGLLGLWLLALNFGTEELSLINVAFGLLIFYYIAFALILCQFLVFKICEKNKALPKKITKKDKSKFID